MMREVGVIVQGVALDFGAARAMAQPLAEKVQCKAMRVAWFDGRNSVG
jgi:hypothetical protein